MMDGSVMHPSTPSQSTIASSCNSLTGAAAEVEDAQGLVEGLQHVPGTLDHRARRAWG